MSRSRTPVRAILFSVVVISPALFAQQASPPSRLERDPQALAVLQASVAAMGSIVPADSVATGTVQVIAGSETQMGTIRIRTRGSDQASEEIELPQESRSLVFSRGMALEKVAGRPSAMSLERALSCQPVSFPLPLLAEALWNADESLQFMGTENDDGIQLNHIRLWNTFSSKPNFRNFAEYTLMDIWVDPRTWLPRRLSIVLREGGGAAPRIPLEVRFSNYESVDSILYPRLIQKSLNGTPWTTVTISNVSFNTGLSESDFLVQ